VSKKKWRIEIVLDFRNNKIKKKSTLDSIMERMSTGHSMNDALVAAEMPVNPEPVPLRTEGPAFLGVTSSRLVWEPSEAMDSEPPPQENVPLPRHIEVIRGNCPRCNTDLRFEVHVDHPVIDFNCWSCGRHITERELHGLPH